MIYIPHSGFPVHRPWGPPRGEIIGFHLGVIVPGRIISTGLALGGPGPLGELECFRTTTSSFLAYAN